MLDIKTNDPAEDLRRLLSFTHENFTINKIGWKSASAMDLTKASTPPDIIIEFSFNGGIESAAIGAELLNTYANHIKSIFPENEVRFVRDQQNIIRVAKKIIIPAKIIIKGTSQKGDSNAG